MSMTQSTYNVPKESGKSDQLGAANFLEYTTTDRIEKDEALDEHSGAFSGALRHQEAPTQQSAQWFAIVVSSAGLICDGYQNSLGQRMIQPAGRSLINGSLLVLLSARPSAAGTCSASTEDAHRGLGSSNLSEGASVLRLGGLVKHWSEQV